MIRRQAGGNALSAATGRRQLDAPGIAEGQGDPVALGALLRRLYLDRSTGTVYLYSGAAQAGGVTVTDGTPTGASWDGEIGNAAVQSLVAQSNLRWFWEPEVRMHVFPQQLDLDLIAELLLPSKRLTHADTSEDRDRRIVESELATEVARIVVRYLRRAWRAPPRGRAALFHVLRVTMLATARHLEKDCAGRRVHAARVMTRVRDKMRSSGTDDGES